MTADRNIMAMDLGDPERDAKVRELDMLANLIRTGDYQTYRRYQLRDRVEVLIEDLYGAPRRAP